MTEQTSSAEFGAKEKKPKICKETAVQSFETWAEAMDIDTDTTAMDEDDLKSFDKLKRMIVRAIMDGSLTFNDNDEAVYHCRRTDDIDPITFRERTGASLMAMDGKKRNHDVSKMYAVMADMTGVHQKVFARLRGADIKLCEALFALLMD